MPAPAARLNLRAVRVLRLLFLLVAVAPFTGCGSIAYRLPGHSAQQHAASVALPIGQRLLALETPPRLPAPGGFWLGLASERPDIVAVETRDTGRGASRVTLVGQARGTATVHYVNRFTVADGATLSPDEWRARSLGSFLVEVR